MTSPILQAALEEAMAGCPHHVEVDFTHVTFCDCAGLTALLRARAAARQAGVGASGARAASDVTVPSR
ncbi:STAS domain-containing protein [Streptomyces sp. NBC_01343]|uniref:STAS domain-containing protein n=1 Tax=Streptomyces sp. NBC_01343 TaxID=2903832 RepID=UPI003FA34D7B